MSSNSYHQTFDIQSQGSQNQLSQQESVSEMLRKRQMQKMKSSQIAQK